MGYNTRPEMVQQDDQLLNSILRAVEEGRELRLMVQPGNNISTEQYRLRRLLAACDNHREACGGKYAGLGQRTRLKVDSTGNKITVVPVGKINVEEYRANEKDALDLLQSARESMVMLDFHPSPHFNQQSFLKDAAALGWIIYTATIEHHENGAFSCAAEKTREGDVVSGFDVFDQG